LAKPQAILAYLGIGNGYVSLPEVESLFKNYKCTYLLQLCDSNMLIYSCRNGLVKCCMSDVGGGEVAADPGGAGGQSVQVPVLQ
jgi:hypothetical protein